MNIQHELIHNACRIVVLDDPNINPVDKNTLLLKLSDFGKVKSSNIFKFAKKLKQFETAFIKAGGDHTKLMESMQTIRDNAYIEAVKVTGLKIEKVE